MFNSEHSQSTKVDEARWAAHQAGAVVIRFRTDGSKAPIGREWQLSHPNDDTVREMMGWPNFGIVCGEIQCLEFEGRFMTRINQVAERLDRGGLKELFQTWMNGYCEKTPSGGLHILVRLVGTDDFPGNVKIALDQRHETLIETRGYHGAVICAPSNGPTHETGHPWVLVAGSWETLAAVTMDEWYAVQRVLASFDEQPPAPPPPPPPAARFTGESKVTAALAELPDLSSVLVDLGWNYVRSDDRGQLWRRPGKSTGISARINQSGRLHIFTTSTPLHAGLRTYDALDVLAGYTLGHPPDRNERVQWLRGRGLLAVSGKLGQQPQLQHTALPDGAGGHRPAPSSLNLPEDFWQATSILEHIRNAAWSVPMNPDLLLTSVLAYYAALIPPTFLLPGGGTLDFIGLKVGPSGTSKTASSEIAKRLLPPLAREVSDVKLGLGLGSGEGIEEKYIRRDSKGVQNGLAYRGLLFDVDEAGMVHNLKERSGATLISKLRSAWSGELRGATNASKDRDRDLSMTRVRFSFLGSTTVNDGARFLAADLTDGGLPQRIVWSASPLTAMPADAEWPGHLDLELWLKYMAGGELTFPSDFMKEMKDRRRARLVTTLDAQNLDAHRDFSVMKVAGVLSMLHSTLDVTDLHCALATQIMDTGSNVRAAVATVASSRSEAVHEQTGRARGISDDAKFQYHLMKGVDQLLRALDARDGEMMMREIKDSLRSLKRRYGVSHVDVVETARFLGKVRIEGAVVRGGS